MKAGNLFPLRFTVGLCLWLAASNNLLWAALPTLPQFTRVARLTNSELALTLSAPTGTVCRIDSSTNPFSWNGLVTIPASTATSLQHTDSAAPFLPARYYRGQVLSGTNVFTGDHLNTTNGDVIIQPRFHATCVLN